MKQDLAVGFWRLAVFGRLTVLAVVGSITAAPLMAVAADPDPSNTGISRPDEMILARQVLMDLNEAAMIPIDRAAVGGEVSLEAAKAQAFIIYSVLTVAPHLFPSTTKPVASPDGSPPATAALPSIWEDFDAFYDQLIDGATLAYEASQANSIGKFRDLAKQLRASCDACHAQHMLNPNTPPK